eukprot:Nk52_evm29s222 gene=Nk52_evmTU29s222
MELSYLVVAVALFAAGCSAQSYHPALDGSFYDQAMAYEKFYRGDAVLAHDRMPGYSAPEHGPVTELEGFGPVEENQFAGYVPLDHDNAHLFYWLFESKNDPKNDPLVIWLQGGPGGSSLVALFMENGPYKTKDDGTLEKNAFSWHTNANLMFVDQPAGTGFSYTENYDRSDEEIAQDFHVFLGKFFDRYPQYKNNDLYIFGESFAGKYIPSIANNIVKDPSRPFKLRGVGIGDGWTDPYVQTKSFSQFAYANGLIDLNIKKSVDHQAFVCGDLMQRGEWRQATDACNKCLYDILQASGNPNVYDIRTFVQYKLDNPAKFLNKQKVREQLHANNHKWQATSGKVAEALLEDMMKPVLHDMTTILNHGIRVLIYNGQFDMICNLIGVEEMYRQLEWKGREDYLSAPRHIWHVDGEVAGWYKEAQNLMQMVVVASGHLTPMDQPKYTLDMLNKFISKKEYE